MGHLDGHLRVGLLVLGLWSGWFELTASKIVCNFTCINCPTYVSVQPMKVIVEVNARGSNQSPYLISTYSCPHEIAVSSCGRQFDQRLSATKAGFAIYGPWCCSLQKYRCTHTDLCPIPAFYQFIQGSADLSFRHRRIVKKQNE